MFEFVAEFRELHQYFEGNGRHSLSPARLRFQETVQLLSRPVHLPMLASVLPRRRLRPSSLRRTLLYSEFIDAIIEREMLKRRPEFTNAYDGASRRDFARKVALEMARLGESRSIRTSELPEALFSKFVIPGRPVEAVRRDLISACFLETKGIDILFFPHKSFWEFLTAEGIAVMVKAPSSPDTSSFRFRLTDEIMDFVNDLLSERDWLRIAEHYATNGALLFRWIDKKSKAGKRLPDSLFERWTQDVRSVAVNSRMKRCLALHLESTIDSKEGAPSNAFCELAIALAPCEDDVAAVHSFRILAKLDPGWPADVVLQSIGASRLAEWHRQGWINPEERVDAFCLRELRSYLANLLRNAALARSPVNMASNS